MEADVQRRRINDDFLYLLNRCSLDGVSQSGPATCDGQNCFI